MPKRSYTPKYQTAPRTSQAKTLVCPLSEPRWWRPTSGFSLSTINSCGQPNHWILFKRIFALPPIALILNELHEPHLNPPSLAIHKLCDLWDRDQYGEEHPLYWPFLLTFLVKVHHHQPSIRVEVVWENSPLLFTTAIEDSIASSCDLVKINLPRKKRERKWRFCKSRKEMGITLGDSLDLGRATPNPSF